MCEGVYTSTSEVLCGKEKGGPLEKGKIVIYEKSVYPRITVLLLPNYFFEMSNH